MAYSIIDLGSNTIRLCVYEYKENELKHLFHKKQMAGLATFVENERLSKEGVGKACTILNEFKEILVNLNLADQSTYVFATASFRNVVNAKEVIQTIKERTGFEVELLSGNEEATFGFIGATAFIDLEDGALIDIGGGSTEIAIYKNKQIEWVTSAPIGSLNTYVRHVEKIIPNGEERKRIRLMVEDHLSTLDIPVEAFRTICGVGGTIRAANKLNNSMFKLPDDNHLIAVPNIEQMLNILKNSKQKTLKPILKDISDRIHTIIPGMIILDTIARYFQSEEILVSQHGLREGYFIHQMLKEVER